MHSNKFKLPLNRRPTISILMDFCAHMAHLYISLAPPSASDTIEHSMGQQKTAIEYIEKD